MSLLSTCGILWALLGAAPEGSLAGHAAVELQYTGSLTQISRQGGSSVAKQFDAYAVVRPAEGGRSCFYIINEQGGGSWAWPERYGRLLLDENNKRTDGRPLHVLQNHDGTNTPVELPQPLFEFASKVKADATWTAGKFAYEVRKKESVNKRDCWRVEATDNFGRRESLFVEADGSLVVSAQKRIFMGRGDEFQLKLELSSVKPLTDKTLDNLMGPIQALVNLQTELKRTPGETKPELGEAQLAATKAALPKLVKDTEGTPLKNLTVAISRDVAAQSQRASDVASLAKKLVGQPAPAFSLKTLTEKTIDNKSQAGRITVLHFWDYKGEPLEEPYGQVGYLDYIYQRRMKHDVDVVGVAINDGFAKPDTAPPALRSVRKLRDFMNLSYPIATDSGAALKSFGDPRGLNAKLPVWVVIGPDGKITHFNVGNYAVKPDEGLKELDNAVLALMRKQRDK